MKILLTLTLLAGMALPSHADDAINPASFAFSLPSGKDGKVQSVDFAPPSLLKSGGWTTCVLGHSGQGIVKGWQIFGTAADLNATLGYAALYDTTVIGSHSAATIDTAKLIAIFRPDTQKMSGSVELAAGLPYNLGLVVCNGTSTLQTFVRFYKLRG